MTPRPKQGDGGAAALRVLTQRPLLRYIASFMDGLPFLVGEFEASIAGSTDYHGSLPQFATRRRDLEMLKRLFQLSRAEEYCGIPKLQFYGVTRCAIQYNALEILRWIASMRDDPSVVRSGDPSGSSDFADSGDGLLAAAVTSYFDDLWAMNWVLAQYGVRRAITLQEVCAAAAIGNVNAIKWLHAHGCGTFSPLVMDTAAVHGHLNIVQFLHANRSEGCTTRAMHGAAMHNYADVVEFLGEHRREGPEDRTLGVAASVGHLRVVKALCRVSTRGCLHDAYKSAIAWDHAEVAAFLKSQMAPGVRSCSLERHTQPDGPRRCQKKQHKDLIDSVDFELEVSPEMNENCEKRGSVDSARAPRWLGWMCH